MLRLDRPIAVLFGMLAVFPVFSLVGAQPRYTITDLGTLGGNYSNAKAINNVGQVTGESWTSDVLQGGQQHAFIWDSSTGMKDLGDLGGGSSAAGWINDSGIVVGYSANSTGDTRAFIHDGQMHDLGTLGGLTAAWGINNKGQVSGYTHDPEGAAVVFIYDGVMHPIGYGAGVGINEAGHVVGWTDSQAFLYDGTLHILGGLGGYQSVALRINNHEVVVGYAQIPDGHYHPFIFDGKMHDLGVEGNGFAINDHNDMVGQFGVDGRAFLYTSGGVFYDLNDLIPSNSGWVLEEARGINNSGQIAGTGLVNNQSRAFRLDPIVDSTPPVIVPEVKGALGNNGWYRSNVTVSWSLTDPESGIASSTGCNTVTLTADTAGTTLTCLATNGAGLSTSDSVTIKIDRRPPVIAGMPGSGDCTLWPPNHKLVPVASVTAADALSGIAPGSFSVTGTSNPANGQVVITSASGQFNVQLGADKDEVYTLRATASDLAGNVATVTAICTVPHDQGN